MENDAITNMNIGLVIISSLLSGLVGVLISTFLYQRYEAGSLNSILPEDCLAIGTASLEKVFPML